MSEKYWKITIAASIILIIICLPIGLLTATFGLGIIPIMHGINRYIREGKKE